MKTLVCYTLSLYGLVLLSVAGWHGMMPKEEHVTGWILYSTLNTTFEFPRIHRMRVDGSPPINLVPHLDARFPRSSKNGHSILFLVDQPNSLSYTLFRSSPDGENPQQILDSEERALSLNSFSRISPNNDWMVYATIQSDESSLYRFSFTSMQTAPLVNLDGDEYPLQITRDGQWVLFMLTNGNIYRVRSDGTALENLTQSLNIANDAVISPDGQWIVYDRRISVASGNTGIYRSHLDGSASQFITPPVYASGFPALTITPDGEWLYFLGARGNPYQLYRVKLDASNLQEVSPLGMRIEYYAISPDGQWIIFSRYQDTAYNLFRMRLDGSEITQLTTTPNLNEYVSDFVPIPSRHTHRTLLGLGSLSLILLAFGIRKWRRVI